MSKFLKTLLVAAYTALLIQYLRISLVSRSKDSIELEYVFRTPGSLKKILRELKTNNSRILTLDFKRPERLPSDLKYILKWSNAFRRYSANVGNGQLGFIQNKCEFYNCFITDDKSLLVDMRYFDAILFEAENNWDNHPILRAPHQFFIFTASVASRNTPICPAYYDSYYNLTWSYRLDSDIRWSYVTILDKTGKFMGPKINMTWVKPMKGTSENVIRRLVHKKKAAAWFVSNCKTESKRENIQRKLSEALEKYDLKIDIFGWCGQLSCSKDNFEECFEMLEQSYYFYLSFEGTLSEDYVTEKLMYPLRHYTVPIVYGGANYSRFLPPGSYLNAGEMNATELAFKINEAIKKPAIYRDFFRWHNHYIYKETPIVADVCSLCKILNSPPQKTAVVKHFRRWWNPDYKQLCAASQRLQLETRDKWQL